MIGLVGTGYSSASATAASYCSLKKTPMISPGSTSPDLVLKAAFPYFMRSIASDEQQMKGIAAAVDAFGWHEVAVVYSQALQAQGTLLQSTVSARGIHVLLFMGLVATDSPSYRPRQMQLPLDMVKQTGARIILAAVRAVDAFEVIGVVHSLGIWGFGYVWIGINAMLAADSTGAQQALESMGTSLSGYIFLDTQQFAPTARRVAFDERWPLVSTRYNVTAHGAYDEMSGLPFFGSNTFSSTVWDTDYAPMGDGTPDYWGSFVYDTVWLYAEAAGRMLARGDSPLDGAALLHELKQTSFVGITGLVSFDQTSQDRVQSFDVFNVQSDGHGGMSSVKIVPGSNASVQWLGGMIEVPGSGRELDPTQSTVSSLQGSSLVMGAAHNLTIALKNSFLLVPLNVNTSEFSVNVELGSHQSSCAQVAVAGEAIGATLTVTATFTCAGEYTLRIFHRRGRDPAQQLSGSPVQLVVTGGVTRIEEVRVGVLLPIVGSSWSPRLGVYQALTELNNKSDGIADDLLPSVRLAFAFRDSKCNSNTALAEMLDLSRSAFGGRGVQVVVGAGCSSASEVAARVAGIENVPIISPSAASPILSNGAALPYFLRTPPSDAIKSVGMVDVLKNLLDYNAVALVFTTDSYGTGGARTITEAASASGISIRATVSFALGTVSFERAIETLVQSSARVIVMYCQTAEAYRFVLSATQAGLGGPGYLWVRLAGL